MPVAASERTPRENPPSKRLQTALLGVLVLAVLAHVLAMLQPVFSDEFLVLGNFWDFVQNRTIIPGHTKYPAFYSYMVAPVNAIFVGASVALGLPPSIYDYSEWMALRPELAMWPARLVSMLCWAVTAWAVYRIALQVIGSRRAGLLAAAAFASALGLLEYSGYGLPDVAMMMWATLSLMCALRLLHSERPARDAAIAGGLAGLAVATKYSAGAIALPLIAAVLLAERDERTGRLRMVGAMAAGGVAAFIIGCPGWILAPKAYWAGFAFERAHMATGHLGYFGVPVLGQLELLLGADPVLLVAGFAGAILWALRGGGRSFVVLATAAIAVFALAAPAKKQSLQYVFVLYPLLAVFMAGGVQRLATRMRRPATVVVTVGLLATAACGAFWGYRVALLPDSRALGRQWINARVPEGETIALDWLDVPRLVSDEKLAELRGDLRTDFVRDAYDGLRGFPAARMGVEEPHSWSRDFLIETPATWLVTSSSCYARFFESGRFTRLPPPEGSELRDDYLQKRDFYQALESGYADWRLEHEVRTGNGPTIRIYRREE